MAHIIAVGVAALDIVNTTDGYPAEDAKIRATAHNVRRGGNAANTLSVLSQLGHQCSWCGTIGDDAGSELIVQDLNRNHIDISHAKQVKGASSPTSYITLNSQNGSRTIIHYRDLPEYEYADFITHDFSKVHWVHFEGRNIAETFRMLAYLCSNYPAVNVSLEVEKSHKGIEKLFPNVQLLFFSQQYVLDAGYAKATAFLGDMAHKYRQLMMVCSWGGEGAYALDVDAKIYCAPALAIEDVIDTIGAGDAFHAGFIDARINGYAIERALNHACSLAGRKCCQFGFDGIAL